MVVDSQLFRPAGVETVLGDAAMTRRKLGWAPHATFKGLVQEMVEADLRALAGK